MRETFAFLLREGQESKLVFDAPDVYRIYNPAISDWADISSNGWWRDGDVMWHGDRFVAFSGSPFEWDRTKGAVRIAFDIKPGEIKTVEMELGKDERMGFGYADARKAMRNEWFQEMAKMRLPVVMTSQTRRIVRNLAVQMLQCLSMSTNGDFVLPRQGGLQRYVWPGDAE